MYIVKHKNEDLYFDKSGREFTEDISRATTYKTAMAAEVSLKSSNSKYMFKRYEFEINQFEIREAKIVLV